MSDLRVITSSRALTALVLAGLMVVATVATAAAQTDPGKAKGYVTWDGESGADPGRVSIFSVVDGVPGADNDVGDSGYYYFSKPAGSLRMEISCVKVEGDWAEFAGEITEASGVYSEDEVFLVSVKDSGKRGTRGDEIGMKYKANITKGCTAALNDKQFGRKGVITGGNIRVRDPR